MGRTTAGLIAAVLVAVLGAAPGCSVAHAADPAPHERVLLRGDVPLRIATDPSPVCALELRVDAAEPRALIDRWVDGLRR